MSNVRVRFAPSPTGPLHIGGVKTALCNYLFAKKHGGQFLLRIEDTDQTRYVSGAEDYILEALQWCGLTPDESSQNPGEYGPYRQSERKELYRQYADQLVESGNAYYAFDTPEELEEMRENMKKQGVPSPQYNAITRQYMKNSLALSADEVQKRLDAGEPYVIRINVPRNEEVKVHDTIRGWVVFQSSQLDDKVIFKSDGMPTYHLANVVDDHLMKISHVIRGEEWLPSTPIHVLLYRYLGWEDTMPEFAHLPLILKPDGKGKLSKRDGDRLGIPVFPLDWKDPETGNISSGFRERGFIPEAFLNMMVFLGWNPGTEQEIFTLPELIEAFSLERIGKAGAKFDYEKGKWYNQQYLKNLDSKIIAEQNKSVLDEKGITYEEGYLIKAIDLLKERMTFISDFWEVGSFFFQNPSEYDEKLVRKKWKDNIPTLFDDLQTSLSSLDNFTHEAIETEIKGFMERHNLKFGDVLPVFRLMISGVGAGPPLFEVAELLGKEHVISRMGASKEIFNTICAKENA